jgi:enamine deaminase RidA (YjgF/YER057c/UK114 family)
MKIETHPRIQMATLSLPSCKVHLITAVPSDGESSSEVFRRMADLLEREQARMISQEIFGPWAQEGDGMNLLAEAFGRITWPVTWLEQDWAGTQAWAITGAEVKPLKQEGRIRGSLFEDSSAVYGRLGGVVPSDPSQPREAQAREVFLQMEEILQRAGLDFSHVLRTWFFNENILSWYKEFNRARKIFFEERGVFQGLLPASTGVGGFNPFGAGLTAGLFAVKPKQENVEVKAVDSPLQGRAYDYGSAFNRAVELTLPPYRWLFISGTASIAPEGETVHLGDIHGQISRTMEVVLAILQSRGMDWGNVVRAVAYFKELRDISAFNNYCDRHKLDDLPILRTQNILCREDLLFEIETEAVLEG